MIFQFAISYIKKKLKLLTESMSRFMLRNGLIVNTLKDYNLIRTTCLFVAWICARLICTMDEGTRVPLSVNNVGKVYQSSEERSCLQFMGALRTGLQTIRKIQTKNIDAIF